MIELEPAAKDAIAKILAEDPQQRAFRIFLHHKGCDGFSFGYGLDHPIQQDSCLVEDDVLILVSTRVARLIRGGTLRFLDGPRDLQVSSGCTPAEPVSEDERFLRFDLEIPDRERFRGKFYKKAAGQTIYWDTL